MSDDDKINPTGTTNEQPKKAEEVDPDSGTDEQGSPVENPSG